MADVNNSPKKERILHGSYFENRKESGKECAP
jgi:hypothetical protein